MKAIGFRVALSTLALNDSHGVSRFADESGELPPLNKPEKNCHESVAVGRNACCQNAHNVLILHHEKHKLEHGKEYRA
jgi:hypothetical protein